MASYPKKLFYRIQEVSEIVGVEPYVLRYWETRFPEAAPEKDEGDQRRYRAEHIDRLLRIRALLYDEKYTIAGAAERLTEELAKGGMAGQKQRKKDSPPPGGEESSNAPAEPRKGPTQEQILELKRELGMIRKELEEWRDELYG